MKLTESQIAQCRAEFAEKFNDLFTQATNGNKTARKTIEFVWIGFQAAWSPRLKVEQIVSETVKAQRSWQNGDPWFIGKVGGESIFARTWEEHLEYWLKAAQPDQSAMIAELEE